MRYPFKLKIKDPEMNRILTILSKDRTVTINGDKRAVRSLGQRIKPIRRDIFIGYDFKTNETNISLKNPMLKLEMEEKLNKQFKKFTFKF